MTRTDAQPTATRDELGFHWQANIFWKRTGQGTVRMVLARRRLDDLDLYDIAWAYNIDPDSWASIVTAVSVHPASFKQAHDFHMREEPDATPSAAPTWNHVVLGDGTRAVLVPGLSCINRITEADGHISCNHGDAYECDRTGHETISEYEVIREGAPRYFAPSAAAPGEAT